MNKLVFATNNQNKLKEVREVLQDIEILSLKDINCFEELPETQKTIEGNAIQKAQYVKDKFGYDCFADDTGLLVEALNGEPGVYSARYAGPKCDANDNMNKLLRELAGKSNRKAKFVTVIALVTDDGVETFEGVVEGKVLESKQGDDGFGYDPLFQPENHKKSFAEMDSLEKNKISHRGKAVQQFMRYIS